MDIFYYTSNLWLDSIGIYYKIVLFNKLKRSYKLINFIIFKVWYKVIINISLFIIIGINL